MDAVFPAKGHRHRCQTVRTIDTALICMRRTHSGRQKGGIAWVVLQHIISTLEPIQAESYLVLIVRVMDRELAKFQLHHESLLGMSQALLSPPSTSGCSTRSTTTRTSTHHFRIPP